ncbi:MAG: WYL domain-containing protein [Bacteroidetes bacterium]|jgi:predicted DNA-binding transcriptional regulator YafY|nr:WYL domain-containing protein [Bacteroidota bacterium]
MKARERILRLLTRVLTNPYIFTKKDLAKKFDVSIDTIEDDIDFIVSAGLHVDIEVKEKNQNYYAILPEKGFKELSHLKSLTESDHADISRALYQFLPSRDARSLVQKLETLYDFQRLGIRALRRTALERIDDLERARVAKRQVMLENYTSNSGEVRNRMVECFFVNAEYDTIQAYEIESKKIKHFRLPRINRVIILDSKWEFEHHHDKKTTDVFRIAHLDPKRVQLKIKTQAYNYLLEYYPRALGETSSASEPNTWYFEASVNENFFGLVNFIMANSEHVEIMFPEELKAVIRQRTKALLDKLG